MPESVLIGEKAFAEKIFRRIIEDLTLLTPGLSGWAEEKHGENIRSARGTGT